MTENLIPAPTKYAQAKGNADPATTLRVNLVFDAICKVLSEREQLVDWDSFGKAEWQLFAQMAETEGVGPLLYWQLGKLGNWVIGEMTLFTFHISLLPPHDF